MSTGKRNDTVIRVDGLSAAFNGTPVLKDIRFHVSEGEILTILGGSGSGKTTLMKHLVGLYESPIEAVSVYGKNPSRLKDREERSFYHQIGVLYQNGALLNSMKVGENIGLPLEQNTKLPPSVISRIVHWKLDLVGLGPEVYHQFPSELSGGMLKRAALARSIVMDPPLLFCDEPGAGLDPVTLARLDNLIMELSRQFGITVVLVTHEVTSILRLADRVLFLDQGEQIFEGTLEEAHRSSRPALQEFFTIGTGHQLK